MYLSPWFADKIIRIYLYLKEVELIACCFFMTQELRRKVSFVKLGMYRLLVRTRVDFGLRNLVSGSGFVYFDSWCVCDLVTCT
jgi:hypothetical protein